jgi:hypothetical protein
VLNVFAWHARRAWPGAEVRTVVDRRPWHGVLNAYGRGLGLVVEGAAPPMRARGAVRNWLGPSGIARVRRWRDRILHFRALRRDGVSAADARRAASGAGLPLAAPPRLVIEYLGHLHLHEPQYYSDFFFWNAADLPADQLVALFGVPGAPLTLRDRQVMREAGLTPVACYPRATTASDVPLFSAAPRVRSRRWPPAGRRTPETRWLNARAGEYETTRDYWAQLFHATSAAVFVGWNRFDCRMHAVADALRSRGGALGIYQRSFQPDAAPEMAVRAEMVFGYSTRDAEVERQSGSEIDYHVAVGYLGDHRAALLAPAAASVRERLLANGARRVVAYFDENSADDSRWHTGHEFMRVNYASVLERLLADPHLGIVLKPKYPPTLRHRLGPVAELLERALATGRCHLYETGAMHGSVPPVAAALSADLVIHGHLCASTAGLEAALAGVPTLLLDREGWPRSVMYQLGVGRVVFTNWDDLWNAVHDHWRVPGGIPKFGNWEPLIAAFDPFRDGRAAERMATFLNWVIRGYRDGRRRETVLADAAERYAAQWGADKISRVVPERNVS